MSDRTNASPATTRRNFIAGTAAALAAPMVITPSRASDELVIGPAGYRYRVQHDYVQLPDRYSWQTTHNVAVDAEENIYVIHEGIADLKDHPSIFVFDSAGKFIRAFGSQFQGGGHGIEVRTEGDEQFLYVCAYQQVKAFAKMTLTGETVWLKHAPMESGIYAADEASNPQKLWGRDRFLPTNFAFLNDGGFLLADGYGSFHIHRYDREGNWVGHFGGAGEGKGTFNTPHGVWIDDRGGREPTVIVCDRAHHTVQELTLDGKHLRTLEGFGLPANVDTYGDLMLVPELYARVTLLGADNQVVAHLGDDVSRITTDSAFSIRGNRDKWIDGKFVHPHDACFDGDGNILIAEWVSTGRITRLEKV